MTLNTSAYPAAAVAVAIERGYDPVAHAAALAADTDGCGGSDDIALTHPTNWLTEDEVGRLWDVPTGFVYPNMAAY